MRKIVLALAALSAVVGCDSSSGSPSGASGFQELYDQGLTQYVGKFEPANEPDAEDGVKTHRFSVPSDPSAEPRGPLCLRGGEYTVDTREGSSDELVIFLQGGGACWADFCAAVEETSSLPAAGILDRETSDRLQKALR